MRHALVPLLIAILSASVPLFAQERLTSDFEIAAMNQLLESSSDPFHRFSAHLNLGDLRLARGEMTAANSEYKNALQIAETEMRKSRERSELRRYARAASYAGLASAKLGRGGTAMRLLDESLRYESDSSGGWNTYASAMTILGEHEKAVSAARNAVGIAALTAHRSTRDALDLNIYRYALASALTRTGASGEAETLLETIIRELSGPEYDSIRKSIARNEQFEILSSTRGDTSAYLSLLNRSRLRLARLFEESGRTDEARDAYTDVLRDRIDDPAALAGMARLETGENRHRYFSESFAAAPFSIALIHQYESWLENESVRASVPPEDGTGARVQRAVIEAARGNDHGALELLAPLESAHPDNATLRYLIARSAIRTGDFDRARERLTDGIPKDLADELRMLIAEEMRIAESVPEILKAGSSGQPLSLAQDDLAELVHWLARATLDSDMKARLDRISFVAPVSFDSTETRAGVTSASRGSILGQKFRFPAPAGFRGELGKNASYVLEFRVLGVAHEDGEQILLLEPERIVS